MTLRARIDRAGKYPVAQPTVPFQHSSFVNLSSPPAGILHTTEGGWAGSMAVFKQHFAPHFIVGLNASGVAEIAQLVPVGFIGLACKAHNNMARVEIEMVGKAKEALWVPDDATLDALASLMLVCRDEWGIPLSHPWKVGDYGRAGHNPHRSSGKFGSVAGWFGHADMPDPDTHWDPGNLNWDAVFAHAKAIDFAAPLIASSPDPSVGTHSTTWLQESLNKLGADPALVVDGDIGPKTIFALGRWKGLNGLPMGDGLDLATLTALDKALKV